VQQIVGVILNLAGRLQDNYAAHAASLGLTATQGKVLMTLESGDSVPMRVLASRIRTDPSNLTGLIDKLEERSLVTRVPAVLDRRVKALVLTEQGAAVRHRFLSQLSSDAGPLANLSSAQLNALRLALEPVLDRHAGRIPSAPDRR
jgi:DNA-binding MarR family transcriptional regulator